MNYAHLRCNTGNTIEHGVFVNGKFRAHDDAVWLYWKEWICCLSILTLKITLRNSCLQEKLDLISRKGAWMVILKRLETLSSCVRKSTYQAYLRLIQNFRKYQIQETKTKWSSKTIRQRKQYLSPLGWGLREPRNAYKKLKLNFKVKKCLIFAFLTFPAFIKKQQIFQ